MLTLDYDTAQRITDYPHPNVTLYRYSTDYLDEPKPKTLFSPSDAISLAMLSRSNMDHPRLPDDHLDFYDRAYVAVCRGLELANYVAFHAAIVMWTRGEAPMESALIDEQWFQQIKLSLNEQVRLWQLIQIRARLIHFQNEWGDVLEGNIWGERETHSPGRTARMAGH
jgi:hypothetical protein